MNRLLLAVCFCVSWAVTCWAQSTAIRPDQICPGGVCGTPDITWKPGGGGYQIGSMVAWRTDTGSGSPTPLAFTSADVAKVVELTFNGPIVAALPDATAVNGLGDGAGFTIQVGAGTLTLNTSGVVSKINNLSSIKLGPYQAITLVSRSQQWYGNLSLPQPTTQTGANRLSDNMVWQTVGTAPPVNTTPPTLTGTATVSSTLTCGNGAWSGTGPFTYTFQWFQGATQISGQTAATYVVATADAGFTITCKSIASNAGGPSAPSPASTGIAIPAGAGVIALRQPGATSQGGANINTWQTTLNGTVAGTLLTVEVVWFNTSTLSAVPTASNGTTSTPCFQTTGAIINPSAPNGVGLFYCPNNVGGNITVTASWGGTNCSYPIIDVQEWTGALTSGTDAGVGNATLGGNLTSGTLTLTPNQANELIISVIAPGGLPTGTPPIGAGQTFTSSSQIASYQTTSTSGTPVTHTYNWSPATTSLVGAIGAFKH